MQETIDDHKCRLDENDPRDLIDEYLIELHKQKYSDDSLLSNEGW